MAKDAIDTDTKGEEEELRGEIREAKGAEPDEPTVINVDDIDDESPPLRKGERQRGDSRYWMNKRQRDEYEENIRQAREQNAVLQNQLALSIQQQQALLQQGPQAREPQVDPIDQEVDHLSMRIDLIRQDYANKVKAGQMTPAEESRLGKDLQKVEFQVMEKLAQKATRGVTSQGNPQQAAFKAHVDMTYPDVVQDPARIRWATGYEAQQMAMGRNPPLEEIMDATRKAFRLGKHSQSAARVPPTYMQDRLSGTARGANGGSGAGPRQVVMTKEFKKMANAAFPKITDERKRHEAFAKMQTEDD